MPPVLQKVFLTGGFQWGFLLCSYCCGSVHSRSWAVQHTTHLFIILIGFKRFSD